MTNTLHGKIFLLTAALVCAICAIALVIQSHSHTVFEQAMTQALNAPLAQTIVERNFSAHPSDADMEPETRRVFGALMSVNPAIEIYRLDGKGAIKTFTAAPDQILRRQVDLTPVRAFISGDYAVPLLGDDPKDASQKKTFSAAMLDPQNPALGYIYVILGGAEFDAVRSRIQQNLLLDEAAIAIMLGLFVALAIAYFVLKTQTNKLSRLASAIDMFRGTQFRERRLVAGIRPTGGDELDRLTRAYNDMSLHIQSQVAKIEETDANRRELIFHVSHDLRSPLATLRGYLETLLMKEKTLPPEDRRRFLEISLRQSDLMKVMIDELFELVRLEDVTARVAGEPLRLGDLVQDVVQKFEGAARQKGVNREGRTAPGVPLISADVGLMERLLDNLIENAIRHTQKGGRVTVEVGVEEDGVKLAVTDTGSGIADDDFPHIFKQFFRGGDHDPGSGGAGLGLAIVKRIVDLHGGVIEVESELGTGTSFTVQIPAIDPLRQREPAA